jgi:hypothetical protein
MQINYFPATGLVADLYATSGGPVIGTLPKPSVSLRKIGTVSVEFGYLAQPWFYFSYYEQPPADTFPSARDFYLQKMNFGFGSLGMHPEAKTPCWQDLRGEWVFVDHTKPQEAPRRLNFTQMTTFPAAEEITCGGSNNGSVVTFRDPTRSQVLRCASVNPDFDGVNRYACELREGEQGESLYWFNPSDITASRMVGSLGSFIPLYAHEPDQKVTAIRVQ